METERRQDPPDDPVFPHIVLAYKLDLFLLCGHPSQRRERRKV